jgi:hypothetical protein
MIPRNPMKANWKLSRWPGTRNFWTALKDNFDLTVILEV